MANSTPLFLFVSIAHGLNRDAAPPTFTPPEIGPELDDLIARFLSGPISPAAFFEFEGQLEVVVREYARKVVEEVSNVVAAHADAATERVRHDGEEYRRLPKPTRNQNVATRFGTITLTRHLYRCTRRDAGEPCIVPAEMALGLCHGASPALAEIAMRYLAEAGATQAAVLDRLRQNHGVAMGVKRLRQIASARAAALAESQIDRLADRVLELLKQADASRGRHKPVLSVGRDGVTLRNYRWRYFENASVATMAVFDRRGQRLGTVYLGCVPEPNQQTLSRRLTGLIEEVLRRWDGPLPRLCYVTDCGENETQYYKQVLRPMRHPRTNARLSWQRVVDFYHTMERIWTMAHMLFGMNTRQAHAWAHRMGKSLKKPNGPYRVLHAAAAMRARRSFSKTRRLEFNKAYNYIRQRTKWMQYHEYARHQLPLGSGITEAACKTVVSQRLKLSGMRWTKAGAQIILDLRTCLISGTWQAANQVVLAAMPQPERLTPNNQNAPTLKTAA